jgi:hypothetical protein
MAQEFIRKPTRYTADQFLVAHDPKPAGVDQCTAGGGTWHVHTAGDQVIGLSDTDWILTETVVGARYVVPDANFQRDYTIATGPG